MNQSGVDAGTLSAALELREFDLVGHDKGAKGVQIISDDAQVEALRAAGMSVVKLGPLYQPVPKSFRANADTYYGGFHTTAGHQKHNAELAAANPTLVKKHVVAQSWKKTAGQGGHDIEALCLTKIQAGDCELSTSGKKPKTIKKNCSTSL